MVSMTAIGKNGSERRHTMLRAALTGIENHELFPINNALEAGLDPNASSDKGEPILSIACRAGFFDGVGRILKEGADPNALNRDGDTPLIVLMKSFDRGDTTVAIMNALIDDGADVRHRSSKGQTALFWALIEHEFNVIDPLIDRGAQLSEEDRQSLLKSWLVKPQTIDRVGSRINERELSRLDPKPSM